MGWWFEGFFPSSSRVGALTTILCYECIPSIRQQKLSVPESIYCTRQSQKGINHFQAT